MKVGRPVAPLASGSSRPRAGAPIRSGAPPGGRTFIEVLGETGARGMAGRPDARPVPARLAPVARDGLRRVLDRAAAADARVDGLLEAAARGKTFSPAALLAMQVTVFRYSQAVEVLSRAADRLVGAVKQTLGTQV